MKKFLLLSIFTLFFSILISFDETENPANVNKKFYNSLSLESEQAINGTLDNFSRLNLTLMNKSGLSYRIFVENMLINEKNNSSLFAGFSKYFSPKFSLGSNIGVSNKINQNFIIFQPGVNFSFKTGLKIGLFASLSNKESDIQNEISYRLSEYFTFKNLISSENKISSSFIFSNNNFSVDLNYSLRKFKNHHFGINLSYSFPKADLEFGSSYQNEKSFTSTKIKKFFGSFKIPIEFKIPEYSVISKNIPKSGVMMNFPIPSQKIEKHQFTLKKGETLYSIKRKLKNSYDLEVSIPDLKKMNNITDHKNLKVGEKISYSELLTNNAFELSAKEDSLVKEALKTTKVSKYLESNLINFLWSTASSEIKLYKNSISKNQINSSYYYNILGIYYYNKAQYQRAVITFQKAYELSHKSEIIFSNLSKSLGKTSEKFQKKFFNIPSETIK